MTRKTMLVALSLSIAVLAGCVGDQPAAETEATMVRHAAEKEASTYRDPREGYTPNPNICAVPPCKVSTMDKPAAAAEKTERESQELESINL